MNLLSYMFLAVLMILSLTAIGYFTRMILTPTKEYGYRIAEDGTETVVDMSDPGYTND